MPYENIQFKPEEKDFSIFVQGDYLRSLNLEKGQELEWILKNRAKLREILENNPQIQEIYNHDPEEARDFIKSALEDTSPEGSVN